MATHGRSGPSRWALGSVAEHVLRATHLPTLLLTPRSIEAGGPERLRQRALVPLDGSELSERILPYVTTLGGGLRVPLTLLRVVDPVRLSSYAAADPYGAAAALWPEVLQAAQDSARAQLERCAATLAAAGLAADTLVDVGPATDTIAGVAGRVRAGWIAMASHGRGGLGGLVLGSTALAVLRHTSLPVLLAAAPPPGRYQLGAAGEPGDAGTS